MIVSKKIIKERTGMYRGVEKPSITEDDITDIEKESNDDANFLAGYDEKVKKLKEEIKGKQTLSSRAASKFQSFSRVSNKNKSVTYLKIHTDAEKIIKGLEKELKNLKQNKMSIEEKAKDGYYNEEVIEKSEDSKVNKHPKFKKVMDEWKNGTLKSSSGEKVTDQKQAEAIAFSEVKRHMKKSNLEKGIAGKVVGTTTSGKPVYKQYNETGYKDYSAADHSEAAKIHSDIAKEQDRSTTAGQKAYKTHMSISSTHRKNAGSMTAWNKNEGTAVEKAFNSLGLDFETGQDLELKNKFEKYYDENPKRFLKSIAPFYQPVEDGESENVLFRNLSKHENAQDILKALEQSSKNRENISKAFGQLELDFEKAEFDTKERKELAKKKEALPDGSFPIKNLEDLKNAIHDVGRSKNPAKAKAWIKKRAKQLNAEDELPDKWEKEEKIEKAFKQLELDFEGL